MLLLLLLLLAALLLLNIAALPQKTLIMSTALAMRTSQAASLHP